MTNAYNRVDLRSWDIDFLLHDRAFDFILEFEPLYHCWVIGIFAIKLQK